MVVSHGPSGVRGETWDRVALARGLRERGFTDLRDADWALVRYLHHTGGASVTDIVRHYDVTKQAASQHVASFVSRGYGTRTRPGDDGRVRMVELTDKGRAAIQIADGIEAELARRLGRGALDSWRRVTDALIEVYLPEASEMVRIAAEMSSSRD